MNEKELQEFRSWVIQESKRHLTGTQLGYILNGVELYIKFKQQINKKDK